MGRAKKVDRPIPVKAYIPLSIHSKVEIELYSEVEGKVPHGGWSSLVTELMANWLRERGIVV